MDRSCEAPELDIGCGFLGTDCTVHTVHTSARITSDSESGS